MIVAFDLDDTLYRELDFVESGFRAVAAYAARAYGVDAEVALVTMDTSLRRYGRGRQFDDLLLSIGEYTRRRRDRLVQVYRSHRPDIQLPAASNQALRDARASGHRLFLVSDGNQQVQANKVSALRLWDRFEHVYLTNRYGRDAAKPSPRVFELMLRRTASDPSLLVYVGDDPTKDFVGVRSLGGHTIRVRTGPHREVPARAGYDADLSVATISDAVAAVDAGSFGPTAGQRPLDIR